MAGVLSSNPMCNGYQQMPMKTKRMRKDFAFWAMSGAAADAAAVTSRSSTNTCCRVAAHILNMTEIVLVNIPVMPSEQRRRTITRVTKDSDTCQTVTSIASRANVPHSSRLPAPGESLNNEVWGVWGVSSSYTRLDATNSTCSSGRSLSSPTQPPSLKSPNPSDTLPRQNWDVSRRSSLHSSTDSPGSPAKASLAEINTTLGSDAAGTADVRVSTSPSPTVQHHQLRRGISVRSSRPCTQGLQPLQISGSSSGSSNSSSSGGGSGGGEGFKRTESRGGSSRDADTNGRRCQEGRAGHGRLQGANLQGGAAGDSSSLKGAGIDNGSPRHAGSSSNNDDSGKEGHVISPYSGASDQDPRRQRRRLLAHGRVSTSGNFINMNSISAVNRSSVGHDTIDVERNDNHYLDSNSTTENNIASDERSSTSSSRKNRNSSSTSSNSTTATSRNIGSNTNASNSNNTRSSSDVVIRTPTVAPLRTFIRSPLTMRRPEGWPSTTTTSSDSATAVTVQAQAGSDRLKGHDRSAAAFEQKTNPWVIRCTAIDMEASYPYLDSFAAAVRSHSTSSWHPITISAAMNHAVKLREMLDRRAVFPSGTDRQVVNNGGDGQSQRQRMSKSSTERDEETLRTTLDLLYDAYLPYIKTMINSRYAINALWVCAKTGYWGAPGSQLVPALLARLRQNRYSLLWRSTGQAHANLWWALSQYNLHKGETATADVKSLAVLTAKDHGSAAATVVQSGYRSTGKEATLMEGAVVPNGNDESNGNSRMRDPGCAVSSAAAAGFRNARRGDEVKVEEEEGGMRVSEEKGLQVAAGGMDLLRVSAAVMKNRKMLEEDSFKPQQFSNIIIAAARLHYTDDPQLVDHLLTHMVKHPGPFKPQAISNTIYGLSELYGNEKGCSAATIQVLDDPELDERQQEGVAAAAQGEGRASAEEVSSGRLPPSLAGHIRSLLGLVLDLGLHSFSPQELSNTVYSLAQLGLRMRGPGGASSPAGSSNTTARSTHAAAATATASSMATQQPSKPQSTVGSSQPPQQQRESALNGELPEDSDEAARRFVVLFDAHIRERLKPSRLEHSPLPFDAQPLSNITWALTTIGQADMSYYMLAVQAALYGGCMDDASPQEWTILLWTLASRTYQPPRQLIEVLHRGVCRRSWAQRDLQGWPILLWSLAMLDMYDEVVVSWITMAVSSSCVAGLDPQGLATGLFSLAAMPEGTLNRHAALVEKLVKAANRVEPHGFGLIGSVQVWLFHLEQLSATTSTQIPSSDRSEAAASKAGAHSLQFGRKLRKISERKTANNSGGSAAVAAPTAADAVYPAAATGKNRAAAEQRQLSPALVAAAHDALLQRNSSISTENASSLQLSVYTHLRSMMLQQAAESQKQDLKQQQGRGRKSKKTSPRSSDEYRDATASASLVDAREANDCTVTAEAMAARMMSVRRRGGRSASRSAVTAESLSGTVHIVRVAQEWLVETLALRVDICVWLSNGRQVVVEVDGPSHYFANQLRTRRPKTALRDRHLSRYFGLENMKTVPYWEWDGNAGADAKTVYLTELLGLAAQK